MHIIIHSFNWLPRFLQRGKICFNKSFPSLSHIKRKKNALILCKFINFYKIKTH